MTTKHEMPVIPQPGEVWLAVELTAVENWTISETLSQLEAIGYSPEIRYRESQEGIRLYALLKHEQHDPEWFTTVEDYLGDELDALAAIIQPPNAISSPRGIPTLSPSPSTLLSSIF